MSPLLPLMTIDIVACFQSHGIDSHPSLRSVLPPSLSPSLSLTPMTDWMLRVGSPSGYAVLNYVGAARSSFPSTPTPQPGVAPWSLSTFNNVGGGAGPGREGAACKEQIISGSSGSPLRGRNAETYYRHYAVLLVSGMLGTTGFDLFLRLSSHPDCLSSIPQLAINSKLLMPLPKNDSLSVYQQAKYGLATLAPPPATRSIRVDISQPALNATGILRWALNDVSGSSTPGCYAYRNSILKNSDWLSNNAATPGNGQKGLNKTLGNNRPIK